MSAASTTKKKAVAAVNRAGALLVYPIKNEPDPPSLWTALHPRTEMKWDWAETADDRVVRLWHLREELSTGREVVYTKWFRGRATFFSRELFAAMLRAFDVPELGEHLDGKTQALYELFLDDSPQTPSRLRETLELEGRSREGDFSRRLRNLWQRLLVVGYGEVDEGAFPALAIGATRHLFEDLWDEAQTLDLDAAVATVERLLPAGGAFYRHFQRQIRRFYPHRDRPALKRDRRSSRESASNASSSAR